jgi:hypothetical protein
MKTTIDLPDHLVREIKLKAVHDGRKLKDAMADLLRAGLAVNESRRSARTTKGRFPIIQCRHAAIPDEEMTPEKVAEILLHQESSWHRDTG